MDAHLSPARLAAEDRTDAERAHIARCPRCRFNERQMWEFVAGTLHGDPAFRQTVDLPDENREPTDGLVPTALPNRYEDLGRIGHGGMGEVRRVRDRVLGRTLAMKLVSLQHADHPGLVARFVEEAQVASQLQHPHIVPVHDVGRLPDGRVWFTMKEVRGPTFTELIRDHHEPPSEWTVARLIEVFVEVSEAVEYAHGRGVVHRDLKPQNVMVGQFGEVLVLDWGLAKVVGGVSDDEGAVLTADDAVTGIGAVAGTPPYMAPEQASGGCRLAPSSDIYALGAILYEVLTGGAPYCGTDPNDVLHQVVMGAPDLPRGPTELVALCLAAMARDPGERPVAGEVARRARAWLDGARRRKAARRPASRSPRHEAQGSR